MASELEQQNLITAARREFLRHGYKKASVATIARQAGIAVGGVYTQFASKKELFLAVYQRENEARQQRTLATTDWHEPRAALMTYLRENIKEVRTNKILSEWYGQDIGDAMRRAYLSSDAPRQLYELLFTKVDDWRARGLFRVEVSNQFLVDLLNTVDTLDASGKVTSETMLFITQAIVEKLFVE